MIGEDLPKDPWMLTKRQRQALCAMAMHGHQGAAAREMGVSVSNLQIHLYGARDQMGARTPTAALVMWVRFEENSKVAA